MKNLKCLAALMMATILTLALPVTVFASLENTGFSDVSADSWYAEAVTYCREHSLMFGASDTAFAPENDLTRAQLAAVLYRIAGSPAVTGRDAFTDTPDGAWYADAVLWASRQNLVSGYGGGLFGPDDPVSREQMTTISAYAATAAAWASVNGIVRPTSGGMFSPKANATRAQVADALMNYDCNVKPAITPSGGARVLVAYFSAANTTKPLAEYVADSLGADIYEIVPQTPYTSADLNYGNSSSRTTVEMNDPDARPAISGSVENMEQYDIVFIGYPIWWGQAPRIVSTFLEGYDFGGKTIVPFCTSNSSGMGSSAQNLHSLTNGANWLDGQRFSGGTSRNAMVDWVNSLGLDVTAS